MGLALRLSDLLRRGLGEVEMFDSLAQPPDLQPGEIVEFTFGASHSVEGWAVGGTLTLTNRRVIFTPNRTETEHGKVEWTCDRSDVTGVAIAGRRWGLFDGSIRRRISISTTSGEHFFLPSKGLQAKVDLLGHSLGLGDT